jgi:DNA-binding LacI/PurR family transcriptional regulator
MEPAPYIPENQNPKSIGFFTILYNQPRPGLYFERTLLGTIYTAGNYQRSILVRCSQGTCEANDPCVQTFYDPSLMGIILLSPHLEESKMDFLKELGKPIVLTYFQTQNPDFAYMATEYLVSLGHRKVGFIGGNIQLSVNALDRYLGYQKMLNKAGLRENPRHVIHGDFSIQHGYQAMKRILEAPKAETPTAIFAATDLIAMGAMQAAQEAGLNIPADLSIVGFDDIEPAAACDPPLTTVRQPFYEIGQRAVRLMENLLTDPNTTNRHILLEPAMVFRSSVAPPLQP